MRVKKGGCGSGCDGNGYLVQVGLRSAEDEKDVHSESEEARWLAVLVKALLRSDDAGEM